MPRAHTPSTSSFSVFRCLLLFFSFFIFTSTVQSTEEERHPWQMDDSYQGTHQDSFDELRYEVPILIRQISIDLSSLLGMPFHEGWRYPLTVKFTDQTPYGAENALAFVVLLRSGEEFKQELHINLVAYNRSHFDFEKVFTHELVHAMMNDAVGANASQVLPVWLHEGLAVFGANQGEQMLKVYVYKFSGFAEEKLLNGLEGRHGALDYAEDYLAIKYIHEEHGPNAISFFVREIIERKGDVTSAYEYATNESWDDFLKNAREFAKEEIKEVGPAKRGHSENPY